MTPIGIGIEAFSNALRGGVSGIGPLTLCDPTPYECRVAAEVRDFDPTRFLDLREAKALPRVAQFAVAASRLALESAKLDKVPDPTRTGIVFGTSSGPIDYLFEQQSLFIERGARRMHPSTPMFAHNGVIASEAAIQLGVRGNVFTVSSACTSGADVIGLGRMMIAGGGSDVMLLGAADAPITPPLFAAFDRLGMMPRAYNDDPGAACRPFDVAREGMVLGEGAVVFVVERELHARRRGVEILAEIAGYGATCDASSHFRQEASGEDASRAVRIALDMAAISSKDLDYVSAHGTGTRENDPFETRVLRRVLERECGRVLVGASKSQFGHTLGASGALEAAAVIAGMRDGYAPANISLQAVDPECDLAHVARDVRVCEMRAALSTNFGFGSRNAALVFRKIEN
ncbi:beta-ketoacyl-[acyl-carrier-protein] synthase family protein [Candidatus Binatia bacterium]|nr:beta-ketoacyl-[acyl-carrier-protein] synthase family protein [Candidatus Binatia bacterium]